MTLESKFFYECLCCGELLTSGFTCNNCGSKNSAGTFILVEKRKEQRLSGKKDPLENQSNLFEP